MNAETMLEKLRPCITRANAEEYAATTEKWMFVTDLISAADIEYDPQGDVIDALVEWVAVSLEKVLEVPA